MTVEAETSAMRRDYYALLIRIFLSEPTGELLAFLVERAAPLAASVAGVNRTLADGWQLVKEAVTGRDLPRLTEEARDEFTRIFLGPADPVVLPYQSYVESGQLLGDALVEVREFLRRAGFQPGAGCQEPEDHIALEFEAMRRMVTKQAEAKDADEVTRWRNLQAAFLRRHVLSWVPRLCETVERSPEARLYKGLAMVTRGFLELEAELFRDWPIPAEGERPRLIRVQGWQGPTMDFGDFGEPPSGGEPGVGSPDQSPPPSCQK